MDLYLLLIIKDLDPCDLASCKKEDENRVEKEDNNEVVFTPDDLEPHGILGKWRLDARDFGGVSSGVGLCCDTLSFKSDSLKNDLRGIFRVVGSGYERNGIFELDSQGKSLVLAYDNKQNPLGILINESTIVLNYQEDTTEITEWWLKLE